MIRTWQIRSNISSYSNILKKLYTKILEGLETEDEITGEIKQVDIFKENIAMTIIDLKSALGEQENYVLLQLQNAQDRTDHSPHR